MNTVHTGFASKPRNPEFGESTSFMQTCFLPWRETRLFPSRLLPADTALSGGPGKEWSGLSILCWDTQGSALRAHGGLPLPRVSQGTLTYINRKTSCHLLSICAPNTVRFDLHPCSKVVK